MGPPRVRLDPTETVLARYGELPIVGYPVRVEGRGEARTTLVTLVLTRDAPGIDRYRGERVRISIDKILGPLNPTH